MRPCILQIPEPALKESPLQGDLQGIIVTGSFVVLDVNLAVIRKEPFTSCRIDYINITALKDLPAFAAEITNLHDELSRQLLLN